MGSISLAILMEFSWAEQFHESFYRKAVCIAQVLFQCRDPLFVISSLPHRTSNDVTTLNLCFFLSNKNMNLYDIAMYLAKVFHFSNFFCTTDDYWKIGKKHFELISRNSLEKGLTELTGNAPPLVDPLFLPAPFTTIWSLG